MTTIRWVGTGLKYLIFYFVVGFLPLALGGFFKDFFDGNHPLVVEIALCALVSFFAPALYLLVAGFVLFCMAQNRILPGMLKTLADGINDLLNPKPPQ